MGSTHTYGYLEIEPKKSVIIGAYVYEFILEVPVPFSNIFYSVQQTGRVTVIDDRLGGEEWKTGESR